MDKVVLSLSNPLEDAKNTITTSTVQFSFFTLYTDSTQGCTKISRYRVFIYLIVGNWKAREFFWLDFPLVPWWKLQGIMPIVTNETVTDEFSYFYHDKQLTCDYSCLSLSWGTKTIFCCKSIFRRMPRKPKSRKTFICKWPIWIVKYCMQTMYVPDLKALP